MSHSPDPSAAQAAGVADVQVGPTSAPSMALAIAGGLLLVALGIDWQLGAAGGHGALVLVAWLALLKWPHQNLSNVLLWSSLAAELGPALARGFTGGFSAQDVVTRLALLPAFFLIAWLVRNHAAMQARANLLKASQAKLWQQSVELERSNTELQQFAYVASHDLREPLRMVTGFMSLLDHKYRNELDNEASEYIVYALDGANRMRRLITDLLVYSRVGAPDSKREPVDIGQVMKDVMRDLGKAVEYARGEVRFDNMPVVLGDPGQLHQVFQNLVSNGIKFRGSRDPVIEVTAVPEGELVQFSVKDNGIGVEPEFADKVFGMFQRLHGREEYDGTGIGLAVCRKIIDRHGGTIWLESEPGAGCNFMFQLPTPD